MSYRTFLQRVLAPLGLGGGITHPVDAYAWSQFCDKVPLLQQLSSSRQEKLYQLAMEFLQQKRIIPAHGYQVEEEMKLLIASLACIPLLGRGMALYRNWLSVIIYPQEFVVHQEITDDAGVVHEVDDPLCGESWYRGPVILSWADVERSAQHLDGYNVVIHEMAHQIDMLSGDADGMVPLPPGLATQEWQQCLEDALQHHRRRIEKGKKVILDEYASESLPEFFAVISEHFFECPQDIEVVYPELYRLLVAVYGWNPSASCQ
ncbi:zinc-dependent peptidase [Desulfurispira natronophila]|uniref:Zinc-dependent peptidase n=1 Tax=Desulfurispira natronophila TaxID=682562 RepID=A0A7W8DFZ2_9BACT|nr:M90 family metallopeptidase [Desulfurispira natronophila]MBB5020941.1 hypothetical protein [Desulfurispira natronophila]